MNVKRVFVVLFIIIAVLILQIFLSKAKNKWLGLIIPVFNFIFAIIFSLNATEWGAAIVAFLIMIVPFLINIGIYLTYRSKLKEKNTSELNKMKIKDLD